MNRQHERPLPGVLAVQKRSLERTQIGNERSIQRAGGWAVR
jgi:hypothetical protein